MRSITLVIAILLGTTGLFAQNVNFHKEMDKLKSMLENVNDDLTKAVKKSKGLSKDLSVAEAKDQVNKSVKLTKNALEITDGFKKQLKKAMKEAQAWGCEKTVENSGVYEKSLKSLSKQVKDISSSFEKIEDLSKTKKIIKALDEMHSSVKDCQKEIKKLIEQHIELDQSCS